jgi:hypothetical protein
LTEIKPSGLNHRGEQPFRLASHGRLHTARYKKTRASWESAGFSDVLEFLPTTLLLSSGALAGFALNYENSLKIGVEVHQNPSFCVWFASMIPH